MLLFLFFILCGIVICEQRCPDGTYELPQSNACAKLYEGVPGGYEDALNVCIGDGANSTDTFFIGGDQLDDKPLKWVEGSILYYGNFASYNTGDCLMVRVRDTKWLLSKCVQNIPFVCELPKTECDPGWKRFENFCYSLNVSTSPMEWVDAYLACYDQGAELASIHSDDENNFLLELTKDLPKGDDTYFPWIGLYWDAWALYQWVDLSPPDYTNDLNYPTEDSTYYLIASGDNTGKWDDAPNAPDSREGYSFICKRSDVFSRAMRQQMNRRPIAEKNTMKRTSQQKSWK